MTQPFVRLNPWRTAVVRPLTGGGSAHDDPCEFHLTVCWLPATRADKVTFMKHIPHIVALIALVAFGSGCASSGVTGRKGTALTIETPPPGKSQVLFCRFGALASAISFNVHDGEDYIGVLPPNSYFAYVCEPGKHLFSSTMEDVALLEAELMPDHTYYAEVTPVMGWWIAQVNMYSLYPGCRGENWASLPKKLGKLRETEITDLDKQEDREGIEKFMERITKYYDEKYLKDPDREQIRPEHGQATPIRGS